tara:strand:- start:291 stop:443 length:153 start_codon:yes stop_codon:yes gene_type:complete
MLNARGYQTGKPDGIVGKGTRAAIRAYQNSQNVPADGYVTVELWEMLRRR